MLTLLLAGVRAANAQGVATVPADSDIYRRIEAISAFFPVPVHLGLRPASLRALQSTLRRLRARVESAPIDHPRRLWALDQLDEVAAAIESPAQMVGA